MKLLTVGAVVLPIIASAQPSITQEPADQVVVNGGTAVFSAIVSGAGPVSYQWQFNGTNLPPTIVTEAGNGTPGYSGDGGPATSARLSGPTAVVVDPAGNRYLACSTAVRKVGTNGIISTVAGGGMSGLLGDGGAATNATLISVYGIALDSSGNLFLSDSGYNRIRKVDTLGIITTFAGNGSSGYSGDGGAATNARLSSPAGITFDRNGNLLIADTSNYCIRRVDTNGIITTVAGKLPGYLGDGGAATNARLATPWGVATDAAGNVFIADTGNNRIRKVDTNGVITTVAGKGSGYAGDGDTATNALLKSPKGVVVDSANNIWIADTGNSRVRAVDTNSMIMTVAGTGGAGYSGDGGTATNAMLNNPACLAFDSAGNLLIADSFNKRLRRISWPNSATLVLLNISTNSIGNYAVVASDFSGSVTSRLATLNIPPFVLTKPANLTSLTGGSIAFQTLAGGSGPVVYQWSWNGSPIAEATNAFYAITNVATNLAGIYSVAITNIFGSTNLSAKLNVVYLSQQPSSQVVANGGTAAFAILQSEPGILSYQWQLNGTNLPAKNLITTIAGSASRGYSGDGGQATSAQLSTPSAITEDSAGNLFIIDSLRIRKLDNNGTISTVAGNGMQGYSGDGGPATNAMLNFPSDIVVDRSGNLLIADKQNNRVRKVDATGVISTVAGNGNTNSYGFGTYSGDGGSSTNAGLNWPGHVTLDSVGNLFISDSSNRRVRKVDTNGIITTIAGNGSSGHGGDGGEATNATLRFIEGLLVDPAGNLFIIDANQIRKVDTNGMITTVAGGPNQGYFGAGILATNAGFFDPSSLAMDQAGNLYIADQMNNCIQAILTNGMILTVAGNRSIGSGGDGGPATAAQLYYPSGITVDKLGNLYIADTYNGRVRKVVEPTISPYMPVLTIPNCSTAAAGNYSVIVSNYSGSVTSSVASLTLLQPPQDFTLRPLGSGLQLRLSGTPNYPYVLQRASSLIGPVNWVSTATNVTDVNGNWSLAITNEPYAPASYYYRVVGW